MAASFALGCETKWGPHFEWEKRWKISKQHIPALEDLRHDHGERFLNVWIGSSGRLAKGNGQLETKILAIWSRDLALILYVTFVADHELRHRLGVGVSPNLMQPRLHVPKRLTVRDIVHNCNTVSTSIIGRSNRTKSLLPRSIPLTASGFEKKGRGYRTIWSLINFPSTSSVRTRCRVRTYVNLIFSKVLPLRFKSRTYKVDSDRRDETIWKWIILPH